VNAPANISLESSKSALLRILEAQKAAHLRQGVPTAERRIDRLDRCIHVAQEDLPFGGVGPAGMGAYHGRDGFLEFSHNKAVFHQLKKDIAPMLALRPPMARRSGSIWRGRSSGRGGGLDPSLSGRGDRTWICSEKSCHPGQAW